MLSPQRGATGKRYHLAEFVMLLLRMSLFGPFSVFVTEGTSCLSFSVLSVLSFSVLSFSVLSFSVLFGLSRSERFLLSVPSCFLSYRPTHVFRI